MPGTGARPTQSFASLARAAIEKHVPEAREPAAHWGTGPNLAWVRWRREDGAFSYLALRRHLGWITGEAALGREPVELESLPLGAPEPPGASGYRVRLGELLGGEDRWWPAGSGDEDESGRIEWIVLQIRVKADAFFARNPGAMRGAAP